MNKLLSAGFMRLRKNKLFWTLILFSIGLALFMIYTRYSDMKKYDDVIEIEQLLLNYSTIIGIVVAIFTSLFLGVEYSDGTIRNKIISGHKRIHIYLSNFLLTTIVSLFSYILLIVVILLIGIPLFGRITMSIPALLKLLGCIFLAVVVYSAIFTFIAMLIQNKAMTAVVSIMLAFGLMMAALTCLKMVEAQEYVPQASLVDGEFVTEEVKNPKYPSETERKIYQTLLDINPAGQMFQLAGRSAPNLKVLPIYSLGLIAVLTVGGVVIFNKKDLK